MIRPAVPPRHRKSPYLSDETGIKSTTEMLPTDGLGFKRFTTFLFPARGVESRGVWPPFQTLGGGPRRGCLFHVPLDKCQNPAQIHKCNSMAGLPAAHSRLCYFTEACLRQISWRFRSSLEGNVEFLQVQNCATKVNACTLLIAVGDAFLTELDPEER